MSRDVQFYEHIFPFSQPQSKSIVNQPLATDPMHFDAHPLMALSHSSLQCPHGTKSTQTVEINEPQNS